MIMQTLAEIREIADKEEKQHHPNGIPNTPSVDKGSMKITRKEKAQKLKEGKQNEKQPTKMKSKEKQKLVKMTSQFSNNENQEKRKRKGKMFKVDDDTKSYTSS